MPVASHHVSLDTAKSWAKRLSKHSHTTPNPLKLSSAQKSVAHMLGFDDWHHLTKNLSTLAPLPSAPPPSCPKTQQEWVSLWQQLLDKNACLNLENNSQDQRCSVIQQTTFDVQTVATWSFEEMRCGLQVLCPHLDITRHEEYIREECSLPNSNKIVVQMLPLTNKRWTIVIQATPDQRHKQFADIQLPKQSQQWITDLALQKKIFAVAGTSGSGRTALAHCIANTVKSTTIVEPTHPVNQATHPTEDVLYVVHSTSSSVVNRLKDLGVPSEHLSGWAYTRLFPVLCNLCSISTGNGQKQRGTGCLMCKKGYIGVQQICDVWSYTNGCPQLEVSLRQQVVEYVKNGKIDQNDAEILIGSLSSWNAWEIDSARRNPAKVL